MFLSLCLELNFLLIFCVQRKRDESGSEGEAVPSTPKTDEVKKEKKKKKKEKKMKLAEEVAEAAEATEDAAAEGEGEVSTADTIIFVLILYLIVSRKTIKTYLCILYKSFEAFWYETSLPRPFIIQLEFSVSKRNLFAVSSVNSRQVCLGWLGCGKSQTLLAVVSKSSTDLHDVAF